MNLPTCVCGGKTSSWSINEGATGSSTRWTQGTAGSPVEIGPNCILQGISSGKTTAEADPDCETADSSKTDWMGAGMKIGELETSGSTGKSMDSPDVGWAAKVWDDGVSIGSEDTITGSTEDSIDVTGSVSGSGVGGGGMATGSEVMAGGGVRGSTLGSTSEGAVSGSLDSCEGTFMGSAGWGPGTSIATCSSPVGGGLGRLSGEGGADVSSVPVNKGTKGVIGSETGGGTKVLAYEGGWGIMGPWCSPGTNRSTGRATGGVDWVEDLVEACGWSTGGDSFIRSITLCESCLSSDQK